MNARIVGGVLLTADECLILTRLVEGKVWKEIAEELHLSRRTVLSYRARKLCAKLGMAKLVKTDLLVWAVKHGFAGENPEPQAT